MIVLRKIETNRVRLLLKVSLRRGKTKFQHRLMPFLCLWMCVGDVDVISFCMVLK